MMLDFFLIASVKNLERVIPNTGSFYNKTRVMVAAGDQIKWDICRPKIVITSGKRKYLISRFIKVLRKIACF